MFDRRLAVTAVLLGILATAAMATGPAFYVKKATWHETMLAARKALADPGANDGKLRVELGRLYVTEPVKTDSFSKALEPEKGVNLQARTGGKMRWKPATNWPDGKVHVLKIGEGRTYYLYRTITASKPALAAAGFGSDDGLMVFFNGKKIISKDISRGAEPDQERAKLLLLPGVNHLLMKIYNGNGWSGFYFRLAEAKDGDPVEAVWGLLQRDFRTPEARVEMGRERADGIWREFIGGDLAVLGRRYAGACRVPACAAEAKPLAAAVKTPADLARIRAVYNRDNACREALAVLRTLDVAPVRLAVADLTKTYPKRYPKGRQYLERLDALERKIATIGKGLAEGRATSAELDKELEALRTEALLANPLLDFDKLLLVRRGAQSHLINDFKLGLPQNWQGNCALRRTGYDNQIALMSPVRPGAPLTTLYAPKDTEFVGDVDLNFDADKMVFSMPGSHGRWQIWEIGADGKGLRQVTPGKYADVDNYDPCYLPNGKIVFGSTRCFQGVPCVEGYNTVANSFVMNADGSGIRQLTFDQDHNWSPSIMNNGRVLYTRWEYSDTPHYFTRLLFLMNPDGTNQMAYYGSNSLWPNSTFYARAIPGHPTKVVGIVSGHHGVPRMGEMIIFDPARGRHEADGVVQRIPGYGKEVKPVIGDDLVYGSWPKFLHPYPLSEKYFLVSSRPNRNALWGIYLVDVFDNMLLLKEETDYAMLEPVPFRKTRRPPIIPEKTVPGSRNATVFLADVYAGRGLKGIPRGSVKKLRIYEFHYTYPRMGGHINIGIDGPWDVRRIVGTVPVWPDGSAAFIVPANTPLAVQPLDDEGKALQTMRSWFTAMPGETLSCIGCHERQNTAVAPRLSLAAQREPSKITPWRGPTRGFSFRREVQPVLDKYCAGCHDGSKRKDGKTIPNFARRDEPGLRNFDQSYLALHPYVRRPGPESDYHIQKPGEWHADTSELVQMLAKGHHGVKLDAEAWDRLVTWIDLNVPCHGTWGEHRAVAGDLRQRRLACRTIYANRPEDPETYPTPAPKPLAFVKPVAPPRPPAAPTCPGWPLDADRAARMQKAAGSQTTQTIDLGNNVNLEMVLIPAGQFVMGDADGERDEWPQAVVKIDKPFWMGTVEVTNAQFSQFDRGHDSGYISVFNKDQSKRGEHAGRERQPVIRVTWKQARAFCQWLSDKTRRRFDLPSEAQWEYACRAGSAGAMSYGTVATDFGKWANLADLRINDLTRGDSPKWIPSIDAVNDGAVISDHVGRYTANTWGLKDMHGNVAEWTRSLYRAYPYRGSDGRNDVSAAGRRVVRGGSWYDRPKRARSAFRLGYRPHMPVFNVGFRVVCETTGK